MEYTLMGTETNKLNSYFVVLNRETWEVSKIERNEFISKIQKGTNFRPRAGGKGQYKRTEESLLLSITNDGKIESIYETFLGYDVDSDKIMLINLQGNIRYLTKEEYFEYIKGNKVNGEPRKGVKQDRYINAQAYREKQCIGIEKILISDYETDEAAEKDGEQVVPEVTDTKETVVEQLSSPVETQGAEAPSNTKKCETEEDSCCTEQQSQPTSENPVDTEEKEIEIRRIKDLIFNMYPLDRVTIRSSLIVDFEYKIIKVLDSNMSDTKRLCMTKIYKGPNRVKCTFALIEFDDEAELCRIQVLGQSDNTEKAMRMNIETFCQTYAKWLTNTKYLRI